MDVTNQSSHLGMSENLFQALLGFGVVPLLDSERIEVQKAAFGKGTSAKSRTIRQTIKKLEEAKIRGSGSNKNVLIVPATKYTKFLEGRFGRENSTKYEAIERFLETPDCRQSVYRFFYPNDRHHSFLETGNCASGNPHAIVEEPEDMFESPDCRPLLLNGDKSSKTLQVTIRQEDLASDTIHAPSRASTENSTRGQNGTRSWRSLTSSDHSRETLRRQRSSMVSAPMVSAARRKHHSLPTKRPTGNERVLYQHGKPRGQSENQATKKGSVGRSASAKSTVIPELSPIESMAFGIIKHQKDSWFETHHDSASSKSVQQSWNDQVMGIIACFDLSKYENILPSIEE